MKHEKLAQALDEIHDAYILEAAPKKRRLPLLRWSAAVAAALAVAIAAGTILPRLAPSSENQQSGENLHFSQSDSEQPANTPTQALNESVAETLHLRYLLAQPDYPKMSAYPVHYDAAAYDAWHSDQKSLHNQPANYADNLQGYFAKLLSQLLKDTDQTNPVCSPVNIYMALAMLAETTGGESRQQILDLLQTDSMDALRTQAGHIWKAHYNNDGLSTSVLGSSLWLDDSMQFDEETVNTLAENYYASVFRGDLGTEETNKALQSWLNEQTGGLLQEQVDNAKLDPRTVLAIATTILYRVQWLDEFQEEFNTDGVFHGISGDTEKTYMNQTLSYGPYYWGDNFGAVYLPLEDGSRMWLALPDAGVKPEEILDEVSAFLSQDPAAYESSYENQKQMIVNLSIPKFDIAADMDLVDKLQQMGVTHIFQSGEADFSPILPEDDGGWVDQVKHATRVAIDEKGVTAAAFTLIARCGAGMPPEDQIDFILDRPFLFYIESDDGLPLFAGIVNEP